MAARKRKPVADTLDDGFDLESVETILELVFTDPAYAKLRVQMREPSAGAMQTMAAWRSIEGDPTDEQIEDLFRLVGGSLVTWNARRLGVSIPSTVDGLRTTGLAFVVRLAEAWIAAAGAAQQAALKPEGAEPPEVAILPMDTPVDLDTPA